MKARSGRVRAGQPWTGAAGAQAVQAPGRRAAGQQLVQAERRGAAVHHQHLHPRPVRVQPLRARFRRKLLLLIVDLPQQVVDEHRAPQVGLGVLQEPELLQGQLQDAAPVLLQDQVLQATDRSRSRR